MRFAVLALVAFVAPSCYESTFLFGLLAKKIQCLKNGRYYGFGKFEDPSDRGVICDCSYHGRYTCTRKECSPAYCGTALQTSYGSCVQCAPQCATTRCPDLKCPVNQRFYRPTSCCQKCYDPKSDSSDSHSHSSSEHDTSRSSKDVKVNIHVGRKTSDLSSDSRRNPQRYRREDKSYLINKMPFLKVMRHAPLPLWIKHYE